MALNSIFCCGMAFDWKHKGEKKAACRTFSLKELHAATNNFNYDNKLGEGGFGSVYWGQLCDGSQIAVKRLKIWSDKTEREFAVDVEILARVSHKNVLSVRGYCAEGRERLIVYDYMPNLSLLSHLHGLQSAEYLLDWSQRMNIAIGSAQGIAYLHNHPTPHTIHGNIKASNILLDSDFQPRVSDFGFTKLIPDSLTHTSTYTKATLRYLAPEYAMLGKPSQSSDIYSFGIVLLELVCGNRPRKLNLSITDWALQSVREGKFRILADPKMNGDFVEEELKRVILVAFACARKQPDKRPTSVEVVELLKGGAKDKIKDLENEFFGDWEYADDKDEILVDNVGLLSEEKDLKVQPKVADLRVENAIDH